MKSASFIYFVSMMIFTNVRLTIQLFKESIDVSVPSKALNMTIIGFQRNEYDIIDLWIRYYSSIFGLENVIVVDHNSDDEKTNQILQLWKSKGLKIVPTDSFLNKGKAQLEASRKLAPFSNVLISVDIDEFLISFHSNGTIALSGLLLKQRLQALFDSDQNCTMWGLRPYWSCLQQNLNDTIYSVQNFMPDYFPKFKCKKIFRAEAVTYLDPGQHNGKISFGHRNFTLSVGFLHYHFRGPIRQIERALMDAIGAGYLPGNVTLNSLGNYTSIMKANYEKRSPGFHKLKQLMQFVDHGYFLHPPHVYNMQALPTLPQLVSMIEKEALLNLM